MKKFIKIRKFCCLIPYSACKKPQKKQEKKQIETQLTNEKIQKNEKRQEIQENETIIKPEEVTPHKPSVVFIKDGQGIGILIRKDLILTTHSTIPDIPSAEDADVSITSSGSSCCPTQTTSKKKLLPNKYFITNPTLDMTAVGCEEAGTPVNIEECSRCSLRGDSRVYILGANKGSKPTSAKCLKTGEGRVLKETQSLVKLSATEPWMPGSMGFNEQGEFSFMLCKPRRQSSHSPSFETKATGSSDIPAVNHYGVPVREIVDWMNKILVPPEPDKSVGRQTERSNDDVDCDHAHHHHIELTTRAPCIDSPRSYRSGSSRLNPRIPGVPYPGTPSTKSSRSSIRCRRTHMSPNPRKSGVSYSSISPSISNLSARSRHSSRSSRHSSLSTKSRHSRRSPIPLSVCCIGTSTRYEQNLEEKLQDFLNSPEFEPPPIPSGSSEEEQNSLSEDSLPRSLHRGRTRTVNKHRLVKNTEDSDGEVYLGVGYMKHTQVSRRKTSQKRLTWLHCLASLRIVNLPMYTLTHTV